MLGHTASHFAGYNPLAQHASGERNAIRRFAKHMLAVVTR
jgi:hypothetical protein